MYIGIREARPGMVLAEDLQLPGGAGLVPKSRVLSEETIQLIHNSGLTRIMILDPGLNRTPGEDTSVPEDTKIGLSPSVTKDEKPLPPAMDVVITSDCMAARLILDPASQNSEEISVDLIKKVLENAGITSGINEAMMHDVVNKWKNHKRHYEFDQIAHGTAPEPGHEGAFHFKTRFISSSADLELLKQSKYYWQVVDKLGKIERTPKGTVLAEKLFDIPPMPGSNVKGEPVLTEKYTPAKIALAEGVAFSKDKKQIVSDKSGVLFYINDTVGIVDLNFNGSLDLTVDEDRMGAQVIVHPPGKDGGMPSAREIEKLLVDNRVIFGANKKAIEGLVQGFAQGQFPAEPVKVADGILPQNGANGKVELLFNTETSLAPKVNPDGSVDYKNISIVNSVEKGKELARLAPPTNGTPGKNVFGEPIPCVDGVPGILPIGPNTEMHPKSDDILIAAIDGLVRYTGSYVEVCEGYVIPGDVDFSTGNIKYDKSVIINGDIKAGFCVECGGDLQVSGIIEDCTLNIGGNVLCKHGFIGQGKGSMEAKGDINLGFVLNQSIKSRKSVNIAKEAINCTIYSRQSVTVHGKPLSIAGGTIVARDSISLYSVGNQSGVRTTLEAGLDYLLLDELKRNEEQEADLSQKQQKLMSTIRRYQHLATVKRHLSAQEEFLYNKLKIAYVKIEEQLRLLEERKKIIRKKMLDLDATFIKIEHAALPGTLFKIGERRYYVKDEIVGPKTVRMIRSEIHIL